MNQPSAQQWESASSHLPIVSHIQDTYYSFKMGVGLTSWEKITEEEELHQAGWQAKKRGRGGGGDGKNKKKKKMGWGIQGSDAAGVYGTKEAGTEKSQTVLCKITKRNISEWLTHWLSLSWRSLATNRRERERGRRSYVKKTGHQGSQLGWVMFVLRRIGHALRAVAMLWPPSSISQTTAGNKCKKSVIEEVYFVLDLIPWLLTK